MNMIYYPDQAAVNETVKAKEPLLVLVSFDGQTCIVSHIDEAMEHHILLEKAGFSSRDIDKYFRIVLNDEGADWTFICPPDYKGIADKQRRITAFYKDGISVISDALLELGFMVGINIPKRYQRHFDYMMSE